MYAIPSNRLLYKLKLRANNFRIFLEYSLTVLRSVKGRFKLGRARNEPLSPVLTYRVRIAFTE